MLKLRPFKALRFNEKTISELGSVVAPPYDIISSQEQKALHDRHPYNIVRLDLGYQFPEDTDANNRYTRSKKTLAEWKSQHILIHDPKPSFYMYEHTYTVNGQTHCLTGLMALMKLEPFSTGVILPHENTHAGPIQDRFELLKACQTQFSHIFTLYADKQNESEALFSSCFTRLPLCSAKVGEDRYRIWREDDAEKITAIQNFFRDKTLFIADGHHRYTTSLSYKDHVRNQNPNHSSTQADYTLIFLTNMYHESLRIYPTHRVFSGLNSVKKESFLSSLHPYGEIQPFETKTEFLSAVKKPLPAAQKRMGFVFPEPPLYYTFTVTDPSKLTSFYRSHVSETLKNLDVSILHQVILSGILNISTEHIVKEGKLRYIKEEQEVFSRVESKKADFGVILNPTRIEELRDIAMAHEKMPQKSTYFYPKLITGLIMNEM